MPAGVSVTIDVREPRPQSKDAARLLKKPGETVTLLGLVPGAHAAAAALRWTNPPDGATTLQPECMEIVALEKLPVTAVR